jgi:putative nucleotidyltransferase with HDIG domain
MPTRQDAWELLTEYTESDSLIKHMLAVEAAMQAYARKLDEHEEHWGIAGLLHDFDYERWPNENRDETGHPFTGIKILKEKDYPEEIIDAILGHAPFASHPRVTPMAKALFAVDELCGLVMAIGYVRPNDLNDLKPKSVKKKLKDKAFAKGVDRNDVLQGIEEFDVDPAEHITLVIEAMQSINTELGFE